MNLIEELAKQMGLSIAQLSSYLGISKSFLSMSLQGKRNLPARHFKSLVAIQQQLNGIETPARPALQPEEAKRLRKRLHRAEYQYFATQRKLKQQEVRFEQLYRLQQWILLELQRGSDLPQRQRLWLELQQLAVQQRLHLHGAGAIADTKARLEALRSLVAELNAALE